jgi:non-ribosomal peptide synthetase-like protein
MQHAVLSIQKGEQRVEFLKEETLADIFGQTALLFPQKTALVFENSSLTYKALDEWSTAVAHQLQTNNIGPGNFVVAWMPRGLALHATILGIVKSGAAYVPLDREMPEDRVLTVMNEMGATAYCSDTFISTSIKKIEVPPQTENINTSLTHTPSPNNYAYILYTSGSTGKPKGIPITHMQICQFVRAEQSILQINNNDRVYQGMSVSFDMWCEETWIAYLAGATLFVASAITAKAVDELSNFLNNNKITVLHAVPSLLAVIESPVASLRLINAGGEACTKQVLEKWKTPQLKFFNSYGPTETTVSATITELFINDVITIGKPLPNYNIAVMDDQCNIMPIGERGELVVTGPGVSNGYIKNEKLNSEKFIANTVDKNILPGATIYRTADEVFMDENYNVHFLGRIDDQVKLRGYRIELGEIENVLSAIPNVKAAALALKKDHFDNDQLIAYIVLNKEENFNEGRYKTLLSKQLPAYMIPAFIMPLAQLPRQASGKIDRKQLPLSPQLQNMVSTAAISLHSNATTEEKIIYYLQKIFPANNITLSQDFFTDLGGHSLLAANFISLLRKEKGFENVSLKDLYLNRPLQAAVNSWENKNEDTAKSTPATFNTTSPLKHFICLVAQSAALLLIYGLFATQIFVPYLSYYYVNVEYEHIGYAIATSLLMFCFIPPVLSLIIIAAKWLIIGKFKEGDYPLWGMYYFKWWFIKNMQRLLPIQFLNGTPVYSLFLKMMGMQVAPNAQLSAMHVGAEDLISIGDDVTISSEVVLNNAYVENGLLKIRKIVIEDHAYIGSSAVIGGGTVVKAWGELGDLSYLQQNKIIGEKEIWQGSPAQFVKTKPAAALHSVLDISATRRRLYRRIFLLALLIFPFTVLLPLYPVVFTLNYLDNASADYNFSYLWVAPFLATMYILLFAVQTILLNRILLKGIRPGKYSIYSILYFRKWLAEQLMSLSLIVLHPLFASVFISSFFRLLGAKVGRNTEISTAGSVTHPLLEIGSESFVADAVTLGETDIRGQQFILEKTVIGNNSFVGNSALIPQGYSLPNDMLIGVLSTPPNEEQLKTTTAKDWFGSPAIALPNRQSSGNFPKSLTFNPSKKRKIARGTIEFIRIILPETVVFCLSVFFIAYVHDLIVEEPLWKILLHLPFYYIGMVGLPSFLITVILKWLLVGQYKTAQYPMWTKQVWLSEAVTSTYEALAVPFFLYFLQGTAWLPWCLKLLGVKCGKHVWLNTCDVTEFDMVAIGDDTALNDDGGPQTHLFEDRVMKIGSIKIGERCSIGSRTIILYDTEIGNNVQIDALSLVMKGEQLPSNSAWGGSPVKAN